uniref:Uncharacterized protein n=1 Tax=Oryza barthii TaxID=65489 RepID=A0A0D3GGS2_9ORYZ
MGCLWAVNHFQSKAQASKSGAHINSRSSIREEIEQRTTEPVEGLLGGNGGGGDLEPGLPLSPTKFTKQASMEGEDKLDLILRRMEEFERRQVEAD